MGKKSSKSKTTNEPPKWAVPHLQGAMGTISDTVNANQGNLQNLAGGISGQLPQLQQMAFGANPGLQAATGYATDVLGGKYLDEGNPYMQGMIDQTAGDVTDRVNSMFSKAGASMGSPHAQVLTKELANAENSLRYGNYGMERQMQGQAAGMMPSLNQSQYAGVMPWLAANQTAAGIPYTGIQNLGQIGSLAGGYGTQSGTQPGGWGNQLLGAGMMAASMFSDRRLKQNIVKVGEIEPGFNIYEWEYKRQPGVTYRGVMADEVKTHRPQAYIANFGDTGFAGVNYARLEAA